MSDPGSTTACGSMHIQVPIEVFVRTACFAVIDSTAESPALGDVRSENLRYIDFHESTSQGTDAECSQREI